VQPTLRGAVRVQRQPWRCRRGFSSAVVPVVVGVTQHAHAAGRGATSSHARAAGTVVSAFVLSEFFLREHSLERSPGAYALSRTSRRFRNLFRSTLTSLDIAHMTNVYSAFFAPGLRRLSLSRDMCITRSTYFEILAGVRLPLPSLALVDCGMHSGVLAAAVRGLAPTLVEFTLERAPLPVAGLSSTRASRSHSATTSSDSLRGADELPYTSLVVLLRACRRLRALSIGNQRLSIVEPDTLDAIASFPRLATLALLRVPSALAFGVLDACVWLGPQPRCLTLEGVDDVTVVGLAANLSACPRIIALTLCSKTRGLCRRAGLSPQCRRCAPNLRLLDVPGMVSVADDNFLAIVAAAPSLRELHVAPRGALHGRCMIGDCCPPSPLAARS
jgi:hypothetical protein